MLAFIPFIFALSSWCAFEDVLSLTQSKRELSLRHHTWKEGYALLLVQNDLPEADAKTAVQFLELPAKEQVQLRKQLKTLTSLEKLAGLDNLLALEKSNNDLEEKLAAKYAKAEDVIKLFQFHFGTTKMINDAFLDRLLGLQYQTEKNIKAENYPSSALIGVDKSLSQTWYDEIRTALKLSPIEKGSVFYDLGSGYGRVVLYGAMNFPESTFKGIEFVAERVNETNKMLSRLALKNAMFINQDVLKADFSDGTHFYMFNPFPEIMPQVLKKLEALSRKKKIFIITLWEPGLELTRAPWLKLKAEGPHRRQLRIFESK